MVDLNTFHFSECSWRRRAQLSFRYQRWLSVDNSLRITMTTTWYTKCAVVSTIVQRMRRLFLKLPKKHQQVRRYNNVNGRTQIETYEWTCVSKRFSLQFECIGITPLTSCFYPSESYLGVVLHFLCHPDLGLYTFFSTWKSTFYRKAIVALAMCTSNGGLLQIHIFKLNILSAVWWHISIFLE